GDVAATPHEAGLGKGLICFGLSDQHLPVGPAPSLAAGTPVRTPGGYAAIETLGAGDLVSTPGGQTVPIHRAMAREVPARGRFGPVRLRAPYLGLRSDVIVSPHQRLLIDGPEVEYLLGEDQVLIEAQALIGTNCAWPVDCGPAITYHQLIFDDHIMLDVAGT
ncbi:hypothetical protein HA397_30820, partial [Escherichia coli]|nr:hypothetical protein [Escherichia coli]